MVYRFKRAKAPTEEAQVVGEELESIRRNSGGILRTTDVVESARYEDSPLHSYFEWDEQAAASAHHRWQARQLISSVIEVQEPVTASNVVPTIVRTDTPAFTHLEMDGNGYRRTIHVMDDAEMRRALVEQCKRDYQIFKSKWEHIKEMAAAFAAFEAAVPALVQQPPQQAEASAAA